MPFFSQDSLDAQRETVEGFNEAVDGLKKVPSQMMPVLREVATSGAGVFRIFNGLDALNNIRLIYNEPKSPTTAGKALNTLRVLGNLGVIALSGIAAAVCFGATVMAAPVIGAALGGTTVVRNTLDLIAVYRDEGRIKDKIEKADKELHLANVHIEQNLTLFKELVEQQGKIDRLGKEQAQIESVLKNFDAAKPFKQESIIKYRQQSLTQRIDDNNQIADFVIQNKRELKTIAELDKAIEKIDPKQTALKEFAERLKDVQLSLTEAQKQLSSVKAKYKNPPFKDVSPEVQKMDREYLEQRVDALQKQYMELVNPSKRQAETEKCQKELAGYTDDPVKNTEHFKKTLQDQLGTIILDKKQQSEKLKEKSELTALFIGPDPSKSIAKDVVGKFGMVADRAQLQHESNLNQIEKKKKWKNIGLGLAGFGIAVAACIPPAQALLGLGLVAIGIVGGVNALYDLKKKRDEKQRHERASKETEKIHQGSDLRTENSKDKGKTNNFEATNTELLARLDQFSSTEREQVDHGQQALDVRARSSSAITSALDQSRTSRSEPERPSTTPEPVLSSSSSKRSI